MNQRNQLISELYPELKSIAKKFLHGKPEYEDLLQDTLLKVLQSKSDNIPTDKERLKHYCITSIKFMASDPRNQFTKGFTTWNKLRSDISSATNLKIDTWLGARADNEMIDHAINFLPELERKVFLLYVLDDFSYKSLSKTTGIHYKTLHVLVHYAKKELRRMVTR